MTRSWLRLVTTSGMTMNGWPRKMRARRALVLGLELVVELLLDARADLGRPAPWGPGPGATDFMSRRIIPRFCMSERTAVLTPGYWTLTATSRPSSQARLVDLADRGGGDRHRVEGLEDLVERVVVLLLEDLLHVLEGDLRRRVAQLGELGLELLAELLGDQADVEERHHLAELHRRALHRPQRGDDLLGRLELALGQRLLRLLVVARQVGGARPGLAHRLARRRAARRWPSAAGARSGSASSRVGPPRAG